MHCYSEKLQQKISNIKREVFLFRTCNTKAKTKEKKDNKTQKEFLFYKKH
jgi:hypothetical protein